ncbi:MAG: hypothetical protein GTO45_39260 [Candidatus Aminicenantes bacterium]|nr:hypothetical protein [Candidatus Aminicenantes bacterium]NIM84668.1 hypothetical protein [Candidatus Aminicenantes bacterium]NIN24167.1 hypothetical protein [Candidatus Aminicenantes bacterium]NIN47892.1 hypothetical protein [Candidatus Aminicenantes bacterium]NIN90830.1 hypothetical protein [Candidatus Aminicenantes bacterium]
MAFESYQAEKSCFFCALLKNINKKGLKGYSVQRASKVKKLQLIEAIGG